MKRFERILPVLVCPEDLQGLELRAVDVFAEEVRLRTGIELVRSPIFFSIVSSQVETFSS